ncbi:hypothetical protein THAOC_05347 [Thalassiosira oceanica]|uniref:Uncharacterized protein n=1 Tax=Thalassiosira oceanica TaxID=159749 RepID=K0T7F6_THAOC|nr:hypothetical protein THAOC_05347 [Thalassiosira oceanica]|eukprot:EJK73054.1 hypothetical protein THAOC_05347 [Thalassiosira oceanica]
MKSTHLSSPSGLLAISPLPHRTDDRSRPTAVVLRDEDESSSFGFVVVRLFRELKLRSWDSSYFEMQSFVGDRSGDSEFIIRGLHRMGQKLSQEADGHVNNMTAISRPTATFAIVLAATFRARVVGAVDAAAELLPKPRVGGSVRSPLVPVLNDVLKLL